MEKSGPKPRKTNTAATTTTVITHWLKVSLDYTGQSSLRFSACQNCYFNLDIEQEQVSLEDIAEGVDLFYKEKVRIAHTYGYCTICFYDDLMNK
jgi:hypothetical protein